MCGVFAEFERGMIRERVNAGLARAKERGIRLGRRPVKSSVEARIHELRAEGMGILRIGSQSRDFRRAARTGSSYFLEERQIRRVWTVRAATREQTRQKAPGNWD